MSTAGVGEGHTHDLPEDLVELVQTSNQRVRRATVINVITLLCVGAMVVFMALLIQSRSAERDAQAREIAEQNRISWCTALDQFPQDVPTLDRLRAFYGCGPGIALEDLPPDEAEQLRQRRGATPSSPSTLPASPSPGRSPMDGALPPVVPAEPSPSPEPSPPADPPPLIDLGGITGRVCDAAIVCF
jgi:hypothetical protein